MKSFAQFHLQSSSCFITIAILVIFIQPSALAASSTLSKSKIFIKTSCKKTTYPKVCYTSLSSYAPMVGTNLKMFAKVSLSVTLKTAQNTSSALSKILKQKGGLKKAESGIVRDCVDNVKDSIYEVKLCLKKFGSLNGNKSSDEYSMDMDSIKTWISAAITDEDTCMDGFEGQKVRASVQSSIRKYIVRLAMVTSNALAIIDMVAY